MYLEWIEGEDVGVVADSVSNGVAITHDRGVLRLKEGVRVVPGTAGANADLTIAEFGNLESLPLWKNRIRPEILFASARFLMKQARNSASPKDWAQRMAKQAGLPAEMWEIWRSRQKASESSPTNRRQKGRDSRVQGTCNE
jgi:hypothetical protein